jgi:hypothetical protein
MTSSTQSISSFGSSTSQRITGESASATSTAEDRRKACAVIKRFIEREKTSRDNKTVTNSYTMTASSSSSSTTTETAKAIARRSLVPEEIQSDISYILVGAFSVFPYVPVTIPIHPFVESEAQTTSASSISLSSDSTFSIENEEDEDIELSDSESV